MKKPSALSAAPRLPSWAIVTVGISLLLFLVSQFFLYEPLIAVNGDIVAYERTAVMINALRANVAGTVPDYYPPLANFVFLSAENNVFGLPFHRALAFLFLVFGAAAATFVGMCIDLKSLRWSVIAVLGAIVLLEPAVFFARFDFFPMLMILLACLSFRRKMYATSGAFLLLGCGLKLFPVFLIPLFHLSTPNGKRRGFWKGMTFTLLGMAAASFALLGVQQTLQSLAAFFTLRTSYAPYALSSASGIDLFLRMLLGGHGTIEWVAPDLGHFNTGLPVVLSSALLLISAAGAVWIALLAARNKQPENVILLTTSATVFWLLFATPLLTMHYYLWVLPLPLLWFLEQSEATWKIRPWQGIIAVTAIIIGALGQWTYPSLYFDLVDRQTVLAVTVNFVRNAAVLFMVFACMKAAKESRKKR